MSVPMIHAGALGGIPEVIEEISGWGAVERAFAHVGLPTGIIDYPERRVPWQSISSIVELGARHVGDDEIGLLLYPRMGIRTYGTWGRYIVSSPTLREALMRVERTIGYHSPQDTLWLTYKPDAVVMRYRFAVLGRFGSDNTTYCAAGVMLSIIQHFLGPAWRPRRLGLSVPKRSRDSRIAQSFGCEVELGADHIAFEIPARLLDAPRPPSTQPAVTLADVERARLGGPRTTLRDAVADVLWAQLLDEAPSIEDVAHALEIGPRTLQRRLASEGVSFREIERGVVMARARDLLAETDQSITDIAAELSYSSTGHFTRAFAKATGQPPSAFRSEKRRGAAIFEPA